MSSATDEIVSEYVLANGRHTDLIDENIQKYEEVLGTDVDVDRRLVEPLRRAFRSAHQRLIGEKTARVTLLQGECASAASSENARRLYQKGYFLAQVPTDLLDKLKNLLAQEMDEQRKRSEQGDGQINYVYPNDPEVQMLVRSIFQETGIFDSISAFYGGPYDRTGIVLHHSSPHDTWQPVFDDVQLPKARTHHLHFDYSFVVPKAMVYLNDVGIDNGVFSVIPHETPFENVCFDLAFANEFMTELYNVAETEFGWKPQGNESIFRWLKARELFASLPHSLRLWPNVGDHIADGSSLSEGLLAREAKLTGPAGSIAVFLGSHVMHRGGTAVTGERFALQAVINERETAAEAPSAPEPTESLPASQPVGPPTAPKSVWQGLLNLMGRRSQGGR